MTVNQLLPLLHQYEQTLAALGKLQFRAHLAVPLMIDRDQSQALLRQNNRLMFQFQQLRLRRAKYLAQLLMLSNLDRTIWGKLQRLKAISQASTAQLQRIQPVNRQRKINRLKQLIVNLQNEKIEESTVLVNQILAAIYQRHPTRLQPHFINRPAPVTDLMTSRAFKLDLMELNYLDVYFTIDELKQYVAFLIFKYTGQNVAGVIYYDARTILPNAQACGFSAVAYRFMLNGQSMCFISYKGTEGTMEDPRIDQFRQRFDNYVRENYQDWKYNIDAMLIGNSDNDDQLQLARRFTRYLVRRMQKIDPATKIYGLGHSLGGHFVQTLQLLDRPFDAGFTLNAAPIQLKQIKHYRPDLFDAATWQQLFELTKQDAQKAPTAQLIRAKIGSFDEIQNEWFVKDLTRIYFGFPYTFYIGTAQYSQAKHWRYPFVADITTYLNQTDMALYSQFWHNLIHHLQRVEKHNGTIMMASLLTYGLLALREVYGVIKTPQAIAVFNDFACYLCDAKIFKGTPVAVQAHFEKELSRPRTALEVLKGEWPFLSSVNHEMVETVIYCHTISGAKYFKIK